MTHRFMHYAIVASIALALGILTGGASASEQEHECLVPERFYTFEPALNKTAKALADGKEIVIAVLGGASTVGLAAGGTNLAWPARLTAALAGRFPSAHIKLINIAVARQTAKTAAERLDRDVLPLKPTLVIWETGTMEAVRGTDADEFRETIRAGIDVLHASESEVVLMNMQFSRETDTMIHFAPYLSAMRQVADSNNVPLFRRHGIMRHWAESGLLDMKTNDSGKGRRIAAKLYDCIGHAMADFVTRGVPITKGAANPGKDR